MNTSLPQMLLPNNVNHLIKTLFTIKLRLLIKHLLFIVPISLYLSACSTTSHTVVDNEPLPYTEFNRATEQLEQLQQCKDQGHDIADSAKVNQSLPQYLLAAKHFRTCSQRIVASSFNTHDLANQYKTISMQLYVASVMNFIKAGELTDASEMVTQFKQVFPKQDFYFANYTSFIDTAEALLEPRNITPQTLATLNISALLRQELLRKQYWLQN